MLLAPWFLGGLLAVGVPLWLHRIARSERIKLPFASVMLFEASEVRDTSRRSVRYWLLLAVRIALLIVIALAFAQPLLQRGQGASGSAGGQLHVIVMDASLSMRHGQRWQRAQAEAQAIIKQLTSNDRALLVLASGRRIQQLAGPVFAKDAGVLLNALIALQPSAERLDYGLLMSGSSAWLDGESASTRLHLITDLQQSATPLRFADLAPPAGAQIELHDVADVEDVNWSIHDASLLTTDNAASRIVAATLRGPSSDRTPRRLDLWIDEQRVATQAVSVDATGTGRVVFPAVTLRAGSHRLRLELTPHDALAADDSYFAVIEHAEPTVLLLTRDLNSDEAAYFAAAIEAQSDLRLNVQRSTPQSLAQQLATQPLSTYSAVFVADSGILSSGTARQLQQYVAAGGALLATLGPYAAQLDVEPITSLPLHRKRDVEQGVAQVDDSHPVLRDASGWSAVRFVKHVGVDMTGQDRALITLADGSPLLISRDVDPGASGGRLLLLTAPLDRQWNDLAIHPLFVRFIADAAQYLTQRDANAMSYTVGTRVATGVIAGSGGQIFEPDGTRSLGLGAADAAYLSPTQLGFYEVRSKDHKRWLAVNADVRESDLSQLDAVAVQRWQTLTQRAEPQAATESKPQTPPRYPVGWELLIAAAILLFIEMLLANDRLTIRRDGSTTVAPGTSSTGTFLPGVAS